MKYLFLNYKIAVAVVGHLRNYIYHLYKHNDNVMDSKQHDIFIRERNRKIKEYCGSFTQKYDTKKAKKGEYMPGKIYKYCNWVETEYSMSSELIQGFVVWMELANPDVKIMYDNEEIEELLIDRPNYYKLMVEFYEPVLLEDRSLTQTIIGIEFAFKSFV